MGVKKRKLQGSEGRRSSARIAASSRETAQTAAPPLTSVLDIAGHPHIFEDILSYSDRSTLSRLLRCSHDSFKTVVPFLYTNLRLTHTQFTRLAKPRWISKRAGRTSESMQAAFPHRLIQCLEHTRTLQFVGPKEYGWTWPNLPDGCLERLDTIVLRGTGGHGNNRALYYPGPLQARMSREITILVGFTPSLDFNVGELDAIPGDNTRCTQLTIVFLPYRPPRKRSWTSKASWLDWGSAVQVMLGDLSRRTSTTQIHVVGLEYTGRLNDLEKPGQPGWYGSYGGQPSVNTFIKWLDAEDHGALFSQEEAAYLRVLDAEVMADIAARRRRYDGDSDDSDFGSDGMTGASAATRIMTIWGKKA